MVRFVCPVRGSDTQTLLVSNPINQRCSIRPVIEGKEWNAATSVTFESLQNKMYEITYRPLTMTADGEKHLVEKPSPNRLLCAYLVYFIFVTEQNKTE